MKGLRSPAIQTILAARVSIGRMPLEERVLLTLDSGERLVAYLSRTHAFPKSVAITVHGLTGCSLSYYNRRLAKNLARSDCALMRLNLRGAGPGAQYAVRPYHAGLTEDLSVCVDYASKRFPGVPINLVGYSLGANVVLKFLSKRNAMSQKVTQFFVVSPPFDLRAAAVKLQNHARFWDQYFLKRMLQQVDSLKKRLGSNVWGADLPNYPSSRTLYEFDSLFTAPVHGFKSAEDYYERASCGPRLAGIEHKGVILAALDDPVLDYSQIPKVAPNTDLRLTDYGGHCGFVAESLRYSPFWAEDQICRFLTGKN